jgi:hypothetical protein
MSSRGRSLRNWLPVLTVAALAWPSTAAAKEIHSVSVCGPSRCATLAAGPSLRSLASTMGKQPHSVLRSVPLSSYYRVDIRVRGEHEIGHFRLFIVEPNLLRPAEGDGIDTPFNALPAAAAHVISSLAARVDPFPAPHVVDARIDGKPVADPGRYAALFRDLPAADGPAASASVRLVLTPDRANPWFRTGRPLLYAPERHVLVLDRPLRVPDQLATAIARDANLESTASSGVSWPGVAILGAWVLLSTGWYLSTRSRRRRSNG